MNKNNSVILMMMMMMMIIIIIIIIIITLLLKIKRYIPTIICSVKKSITINKEPKILRKGICFYPTLLL